MKTLKLMMDFGNGPIWKDKYDPDSQQLLTGIEVIDNDYALKVLNEEAQEIMESFYSFNDESGCEFNYDAFDKRKGDLMSLIETIKSRLESINDGSFYVLDETERFLTNDLKE